MAQDNNKSADIDFNSENIFNDFTESEEIKQEVKKFEENEARNIFFYLKKTNTVLFWLNIVVFVGIAIMCLYIYVQSQTEKKSYDFLSPICTIFLWNANVAQGSCYWVTPVLSEYKSKLETTKKDQSWDILNLMESVYSIENFNLSKKVSFLLDKSNSRLKPLEIIKAFDDLKTTFAPVDKSEISCSNIEIQSPNILSISCDAYSSDWDSKIVDLDNGNLTFTNGWGTSVSRASSFINFINNYEDSPFKVIEKPESLTSIQVQSGPYTQKTTIDLRLQYDGSKDLSF